MVEILRMFVEMGGSINGEHGVGLEKCDDLPEQFDEIDTRAMTRLRRAVDERDDRRRRPRRMRAQDAQEFTFAALAGTPLRRVVRILADQGQALPSNPPLVEAGARSAGPWRPACRGRGASC